MKTSGIWRPHRWLTFETEILKVVDPLRVLELDKLSDSAAISVTQMALQCDVVVLHWAAREPVLQIINILSK